jgi:transcriptional regulator with XRE-family HTH domain
MKLTTFGKVIRKLRIDHGLLLGNMAKKIGVSSAYLSSIELGERSIPKDFFQKIKGCSIFNKDELSAIEESITHSLKEFKFTPSTNSQKELMASLARSLDRLTEEQINIMHDAINNNSEEKK